MGRTRTLTLEMLLFRVEMLLRHGKAELLGLEWSEVASLVNAQGHGAKNLDPVMLGGGERVDFDAELLERSGKSKTGFAGVNATSGNSFRALVPDVPGNGGSRYLPSRPTALLAAIDRYKWFEEHGLPYGNVGFHVEQIRARKGCTVEEALLELRLFLSDGNTYGMKNPCSLADVDRVLARYREVRGIDHPLEVEPAPPPEKPRAAVVTCDVCEQPITEGDAFRAVGTDGYAHTSC